MKRLLVVIVCITCLADLCTAQTLPKLKNMKGEFFTPQPEKNKATVFIFLSPECPVCQGYSLTLKKLNALFMSKKVQFYGVVPGNYFTATEVIQFQKKYQLPFPLTFDNQKKLVAYLHATITPEVFVLDQESRVLYSGRIDNWAYAPGKKRAVVTENDLENALNAIIAGRRIQVKKTKAVGCFIE